MFVTRNNFREKLMASGCSIFLLSCFFTSPHALAQAPGCSNTMPGNTAGDLGCVTFTYKGQSVTYTTVRADDGNVWLQQNLGASSVATAKNDTAAYGDLFQWGRWDDGHQSRSAVTGTTPATNNPLGLGAGSSQFITGLSSAAWWNGGQLTDTWDAASPSGAGATQGVDPCKVLGAGWRLPTQAEWADVVTDEAITTPDLAFSSNLKLTVGGSRSSSSGSFDFTGTRGYYWSSTTSSTGGKYYYFSAAVNNPSAGNTRGGGASVRCLNSNGSVSVVDSVTVNTLNNVAATITNNAGTLSIQATVFPAIVSQAVTWSVQPVSGAASISNTGVVTAQSNGTVWAKAVSVTDATKSDSLLITISSQVVPVTAVEVTTQNNVPSVINTNAGTLQMIAAIAPATADQSIIWSIIPGSGAAGISNTGVVTGQSNGTVWAKAVSVSDNSKSDSLQITISNQAVLVTSLDVTTQNNVPAAISANGGTLQMVATVLPGTANPSVTWSIVAGSGTANVNNAGLVTAIGNGTVWAKAVAVSDNTKSDSLQITISGQGSTSINAAEQAIGLSAYPNPVQQQLLISVAALHPDLTLTLTDLYGRTMSHGTLPKDQHICSLTTGQLAPGIYLLSVKGKGIQLVHKIVKQ